MHTLKQQFQQKSEYLLLMNMCDHFLKGIFVFNDSRDISTNDKAVIREIIPPIAQALIINVVSPLVALKTW